MKTINNLTTLIACIAAITSTATNTKLEAASIAVPNYSFEDGGDPGDSGGISPIPSWSFTTSGNGRHSYVDPSSFYYAGADGNKSALPGTADRGQHAQHFVGINQPITESTLTSSALTTISLDTTYTLTVALGNDFVYLGSGTYVLQLLGNSTVYAGIVVGKSEISSGTFADFSTSFTTTSLDSRAGENLTVNLVSITDGQSHATRFDFDNVRLDATSIPEPSSAAFLIGGVALVAALRRRKKISRTRRSIQRREASCLNSSLYFRRG